MKYIKKLWKIIGHNPLQKLQIIFAVFEYFYTFNNKITTILKYFLNQQQM